MKKLDLQSRKLDTLGQMAGGIAHDVNNILSSIEAEARAVPDNDARARLLHLTRQGAELTRQLLAFAQQKVGVEETIDLAEFLRGMEPVLGRLAGREVELSFELESTNVTAIRSHLTQIVLNLALNAVEAMPEGGRLRVSCRDGRLRIEDDGKGIPAHLLPRIFEPYFTTKQRSGAGMGLSVVHGLVSQMGAEIAVSSPPRRGARFEITFGALRNDSATAVQIAPLPIMPPAFVLPPVVQSILDRARQFAEEGGDDDLR